MQFYNLPITLDIPITLTDPSGEVESPNFPDPYPNGFSCVWIIDVGVGNSLQATIKSLDLEYEEDCDYDYLQV